MEGSNARNPPRADVRTAYEEFQKKQLRRGLGLLMEGEVLPRDDGSLRVAGFVNQSRSPEFLALLKWARELRLSEESHPKMERVFPPDAESENITFTLPEFKGYEFFEVGKPLGAFSIEENKVVLLSGTGVQVSFFVGNAENATEVGHYPFFYAVGERFENVDIEIRVPPGIRQEIQVNRERERTVPNNAYAQHQRLFIRFLSWIEHCDEKAREVESALKVVEEETVEDTPLEAVTTFDETVPR